MADVKSLCDTCAHDKYPGGCEYACTGVELFDDVNEVVTACNDYEEGQL